MGNYREYASGHGAGDKYELETFINGNWSFVSGVNKSGAALTARASANKTGCRHRVMNVTKGKVYLECDPK